MICSIDDAKLQTVQENYRTLLGAIPHEMICIRDAKSLAEAYNRAIARAQGEYLILSHDDIRVLTPDFGERLLSHLNRFDMIGVAGTTQLNGGAWFLRGYPHNYQLVISPNPGTDEYIIFVQGDGPVVTPEAQALDGLFIATRTSVARNLLFDHVIFDGFHLYDIDFTYRAFLAEYRLAICRDIVIIHESHGKFDWMWEKYRQRFEEKFSAFLPNERVQSPPVVGRFLLDRMVLSDPRMTTDLCRESELEYLIQVTRASKANTNPE